MAERRRWGWRMWSGGGEKHPPLEEASRPVRPSMYHDERAIGEKAYPASYNVLLTRLATMVLLTVFVSAATLLTFLFMRTTTVHTVNTLDYGVRRELLNRAADQVVSLLDSQARCSVLLARAMDYVWSYSPQDYENLTGTDNQIVASYFLSCKDTTGSGFCAANGIYRYDYVNNDPKDPTRNTTFLSIFSNATSPAHVAPKIYAEVLDLKKGIPVRPASLFPASNDCRERPYYLGAKASPTGKSLTLINAVAGGPTLVSALAIGNGEKGVVTMTMVLTAVSSFLGTLDLRGGIMYITAGAFLVASSDGYAGVSGNVSRLLLPSESSNPTIRASAAYLGADPHTESSSAHDVKLVGVKYFMDAQVFQYEDLRFTIVMLVPRSAIMHDIDRQSKLTVAILIAGTAGIGVIGSFLVVLLTSPVSEEIKLKRELILQLEATQKAEARNETKSRFLANMSHELRSPMASIIGLLDLLLDDDLTSPQRGNVMQIRECAAGLLGLLNDLLDISKIEAGKMTLESTDFDIVGLMENLVDIMSVQSARKGVELALDLPDGLFGRIVYGDPARIRQIFTNLINNAIKFTAEGYVLVRCHADETKAGWVIFDIEDTGCGIPKDRTLSVFEAFVQADESTTRLHGGTGLGLTIVKSFIELIGGTITIEEKATPGTLFRVRLFFRGEEAVPSEIIDVGKRPEDVSVQPPANANRMTPPQGEIPQVLNLAEAALRVKVLGGYKRTTRAHTLNYLDLDSGQADVRRLYNEIEERRAGARRSVRRVRPLGGTRAEFRTGDPFQTPMQMSAEAVTVPTAGSPTSGPALGKRLRRSVTVPAGHVSLVADTVLSVADTVLSKYFKAFCRQLSRIRSRSGSAENPREASAVAGPQGGVNLTKPQEPPVRASVLLAIKGAVNQEIAARFLQERGMLVTKARDWSSALARLEGVTAPDLGKTNESDPGSGRSSWEIDGVGDGSMRIEEQKQSEVSPRAQSCLLHENASRAATALGEAPIRRSMTKISRSKEGGHPFSLVLLDVALMPCALSDAESVDRCLREVHRILGGVEEESDWGNSPAGRGAQNEGTTGVKPRNAAAKTESASLLMGSGTENQPVIRPVALPHVVWVLGNETPAIVRRLLRSAPSSSIIQKPVFISRLRALLDNLNSAASHTPGTPSEPAVEEGALLAETPAHRPAMEKPRPGLQVSIPEKPSSEEIVASPSSEKAPSNGTPTSPRSPVHLTPAAQEAMQQFIVAKYKVLVAEDTPLLRQLAKALLTKTMNASVTAVENGQEAVAAIEEANFGEGNGDGEPGGERRAFDFVLMDCQMPVMDGYAAVRAIRKLEADRNATRRLPVFALTAHAMAEDEAKCLEAGMDRYLTKPLERGKLAEAIRAVMQE